MQAVAIRSRQDQQGLVRAAARRVVNLLLLLLLYGVLAATVLGLPWFWFSRPDRVPNFLLPTPESVWQMLPRLLTDSQTWSHLSVTGYEFLLGFGIALSSGIAVGAWAGQSLFRTVRVEPLLIYGYMAPTILLYPIFLLMFGAGPSSKIAFAAVNGWFPIAMNTLKAMRAVDQRLITVATSMGASKRQVNWKVKLPAVIPMIMSGVRVGAALAMVSVIAAEMLASPAGIGAAIAHARLSPARMYAYIAIALVFVAVFNAVISRLDARWGGPGRG